MYIIYLYMDVYLRGGGDLLGEPGGDELILRVEHQQLESLHHAEQPGRLEHLLLELRLVHRLLEHLLDVK